jgi:hypothetical protein
MKIVENRRKKNHRVVAIRCDRCGHIEPNNPASDHPPIYVTQQLGPQGIVLAADLCNWCAGEYLTFVEAWRPSLRIVARYSSKLQGFQYSEDAYDNAAGQLITYRADLD